MKFPDSSVLYSRKWRSIPDEKMPFLRKNLARDLHASDLVKTKFDDDAVADRVELS